MVRERGGEVSDCRKAHVGSASGDGATALVLVLGIASGDIHDVFSATNPPIRSKGFRQCVRDVFDGVDVSSLSQNGIYAVSAGIVGGEAAVCISYVSGEQMEAKPETDYFESKLFYAKGRETVNLWNPALQKCFESELEDNPELEGRVIVRVTVPAATNLDTETVEADIDDSRTTLDHEPVHTCMTDVFEKMPFDRFAQEEKQTVFNYPLVFRNVD